MNAKKLLLPATAALAILGAQALADTVLFSSRSGDVTFRGPLGSTYVKAVPVTGFNVTPGNEEGERMLRPAGTLLAGYVTMAPSPVDGRRWCVFTTQTITNLYLTANTGQTLQDAVTTLAANARVCYTFSLSNTTWNRSQ